MKIVYLLLGHIDCHCLTTLVWYRPMNVLAYDIYANKIR